MWNYMWYMLSHSTCSILCNHILCLKDKLLQIKEISNNARKLTAEIKGELINKIYLNAKKKKLETNRLPTAE